MVQKLRSCKEADFWLEGPADDSEIAEPCLPKDAGAGDWNPGLAAGVTGAACFETACSFSASRRAFAAWAGESHGCKYCNVNCVHLYPCYLQVTILINQIEAWKHQGYHHRIASSHWLSSALLRKSSHASACCMTKNVVVPWCPYQQESWTTASQTWYAPHNGSISWTLKEQEHHVLGDVWGTYHWNCWVKTVSHPMEAHLFRLQCKHSKIRRIWDAMETTCTCQWLLICRFHCYNIQFLR